MQPVIAHIYTRGLLSTYEKKNNPFCEGKAVAVIQNNRVVDYCPKAKNAGITLGMLKKHASYNLPDCQFANFRKDNYRDLTDRLLKHMAALSPRVENYNVQEMFLDLTGEHNIENVLAQLSQSLVPGFCDNIIISLAKTRLTARACSLSLTYLAPRFWRHQVHLDKPDKNITKAIVASLDSTDEKAFWSNMPIQLLWPLEKKTIEQLKYLGITTCRELQETSSDELSIHFGRRASHICRLSNGVDYSRVPLTKEANRLIRFYPLYKSSDLIYWGKIAAKAAHSLALELTPLMKGFRILTLSVVDEKGFVKTKTRNFNRLLHAASAIKNNIVFLLEQMQITKPLYSMTVSLEDLRPLPIAQMEIFLENSLEDRRLDEEKAKRLADVIKNLNEKYPSRLVRLGSTLALSRREQMLQLWDPLRFNHKSKEVNTKWQSL